MRYNQAMSLSQQQVEHIAALARLELSAEELDRFRRQLAAILDHFQQLQSLEIPAEVLSADHPEEGMTLRPDELRPGLALDALMRNAPESERRQFKIPPVFE